MTILFLIPALVTAIAVRRPLQGLAALILLWPAYLLRGNVFGIPTTALELSLYGVAAVTALYLLLKRQPWHWVRMGPVTWWLLGGWILAWVLATAVSPAQEAAFGAFKAWLADPLLFCALLAILTRSEADRRFLVQTAVLSGVIVAAAGLFQLAGWRETLQEGRLSSFFAPVANYAAMYIAPLLMLNAALVLWNYLRGPVWWMTLGVMTLALGLTLSYGGYLAVAAAGLFLWHYLPAGRTKRNLLISGAAVAIVGLAVLMQTKNFDQHFGAADRSSGKVRVEIWTTSWKLIEQHPLFGIGPNNFEAFYREEAPKYFHPPLEWLVSQPHNLFLALWLEVGLLGLVVFLALLGYHFVLVWRGFLPDPRRRAIALASLGALVAIVIHGLIDTPYFKNDLALEFMFLAVLPWLGEGQA